MFTDLFVIAGTSGWLAQVSKGYDLMDQRKEGAIKVVFSPSWNWAL